MAKQIQFEYNGKEYTLEFTRKTVSDMERKGFIASEITDKPMTTLPALFAGAFLAHHRYEKQEVIDSIYDGMANRADLIGRLAEMYNDPIMSLIEDKEDAKGNVSWTANY